MLLATRKGIVKKTELEAFSNPRSGGIIALGVEDDDALIDAVLTSGKNEILLGTRSGMAIHFGEEDVRPWARTAYGVKGIASWRRGTRSWLSRSWTPAAPCSP